MNIRLYKKSDLNTLLGWYKERNQHSPLEDMFTTDSTFILEEDGNPVMCVSVYLTNSKDIAFLEHLASAPNFKQRAEGIETLTKHAEDFVKEQGFKRLITLISRNSLKCKYMSYGYFQTNDNLTMYIKELVR